MSFVVDCESRSRNEWVPPDSWEREREALLVFLVKNKGVWFTARELAVEVGFPASASCVQLRKAVRVLRFAGWPVLSGVKGFRLADGGDEVRRQIRRLRERAAEVSAVADAMERRCLV